MKRLLLTFIFSLITVTGFCATYVNDGSINWNGNWQKTVKVDALHASTNLNVDSGTTQYSGYWTGVTGNTDLGCLAYLATLTTPATGRTITVTLESDDNTDFSSPTAEQTATYVTASGTKLLSWIYFKLGAGEAEDQVTPLYYRYKFVTDNAADTGFRSDNAATTKVAIVQVLSQTGTVATTDVTYVVGASTQTSGNPDAATVTYNVETGANTGGDDGDGCGNIFIANGGVLAFSTTASKNYYLEVIGNIDILNGGTFNIGAGTAIPSTSTATLEFQDAAAARYLYVRSGAIFRTNGGKTLTSWRTTSSDAIAAVNDREVGTSIDCSTAGWAINDEVLISNTHSAVRAETENHTLSAVGTSSITIDENWTNTHLSGAEITNLTKNVVILASYTNEVIIYNYNTVLENFNCDWTEFRNLKNNTNGTGSIHFNSSTVVGTIDYCYFNKCGGSFPASLWINGCPNLSFTGNIFDGNYTIRILIYIGQANNLRITDSIFVRVDAGSGDGYEILGYVSSINRIDVIFTSCNFYDTNGSNNNCGVTQLWSGYLEFNNCKFWNFRSRTFSLVGGIPILIFRNCVLGGDGTNTIANTTNDCQILIDSSSTPLLYFYNTSILGSAAIINNSTASNVKLSSHNHGGISGRYKTWKTYGTLTDNTTTAVTAQGGSGTCLVMNPTSAVAGNTLNWEFWIPVTAATNPQLKFYINASAGTPTLNIDIYDSDDDNTLLCNNESLTFGGTITDWTQKTPTFAANPTDTGYCRVVLKALDDGSSRNIGIDTLTYALDGTTYTVDFERWKNGLPEMSGEGAGAGGGGGGASFFTMGN